MTTARERPLDLLLEIGTEEIPARFIPRALDDLAAAARAALAARRLTHGEVRTFGTPRRLVLAVRGIVAQQPDLASEVTGPPKKAAYGPDGALTKAGAGLREGAGGRPEGPLRQGRRPRASTSPRSGARRGARPPRSCARRSPAGSRPALPEVDALGERRPALRAPAALGAGAARRRGAGVRARGPRERQPLARPPLPRARGVRGRATWPTTSRRPAPPWSWSTRPSGARRSAGRSRRRGGPRAARAVDRRGAARARDEPRRVAGRGLRRLRAGVPRRARPRCSSPR